jgi:hypothetical protein
VNRRGVDAPAAAAASIYVPPPPPEPRLDTQLLRIIEGEMVVEGRDS